MSAQPNVVNSSYRKAETELVRVNAHFLQGLWMSLQNAGKKDWSRKVQIAQAQWTNDEKLMRDGLAELKRLNANPELITKYQTRLEVAQ